MTCCYLSRSHQAFIEKILNLDETKRYRLVTCGEGELCISTLLSLDRKHFFTRVITEAHLAYNRVALTEYFQHRSVEKLYLNQGGCLSCRVSDFINLLNTTKVEWYARQDPERFIFYTGEQVTSLDTAAHLVTTSEGRVITYDYCVLATGSESALPPYIPPERLAETRGIFVYRNIADLDKILGYSQEDHVKGGHVGDYSVID